MILKRGAEEEEEDTINASILVHCESNQKGRENNIINSTNMLGRRRARTAERKERVRLDDARARKDEDPRRGSSIHASIPIERSMPLLAFVRERRQWRGNVCCDIFKYFHFLLRFRYLSLAARFAITLNQ